MIAVTTAHVTPDERARLAGSVAAIMESNAFDGERLVNEVRRAMSGRNVPA